MYKYYDYNTSDLKGLLIYDYKYFLDIYFNILNRYFLIKKFILLKAYQFDLLKLNKFNDDLFYMLK
jgi:hypothetical protein